MEFVIPLFIFSLTAAIMLILGIIQYRSDKPANFYSGGDGIKPEEISDISAWNHRHGIMWIIYGLVILVTGVLGIFTDNEILTIILLFGGSLVPIPFMVVYHHKLEKKYRIRK